MTKLIKWKLVLSSTESRSLHLVLSTTNNNQKYRKDVTLYIFIRVCLFIILKMLKRKKKDLFCKKREHVFQYRSEFYMPDSRFSVFFYDTNRSVQDVTYFLFFFLVKRTRKSKTRRPSTEPLKKKKRRKKKQYLTRWFAENSRCFFFLFFLFMNVITFAVTMITMSERLKRKMCHEH